MTFITIAFQILVPLGIFNVWLLRSAKSTTYRGMDSKTLREEFAAYGLTTSVFYAVGFLKLASAVGILLGFIFPALVGICAAVIAILMLGAIAAHIKVKDTPVKSFPAIGMLIMSLWLVYA